MTDLNAAPELKLVAWRTRLFGGFGKREGEELPAAERRARACPRPRTSPPRLGSERGRKISAWRLRLAESGVFGFGLLEHRDVRIRVFPEP
jgi:hypothetical protein